MQTIAKLEEDIVNITMRINQEFPELSKFIEEIPIKYFDKDEVGINIKNMEEHYSTLVEMLAKYSKTHKENIEN